MSRIRPVLCAAALIMLSACAPPPKQTYTYPQQTLPAFDNAEHEPYRHSGSASINGQGFMRQRGGGTVTCAGSRVILAPATSYFRAALSIAHAGQAPQPVKGYARIGQCDAQGNFHFAGVPALRWIVMTEVSWEVLKKRQGGVLSREVDAVDGSMVQVLLTDRDFSSR